eukprot:COSAG01_NODE_432_length_17115_cov_126.732593_3_plen_118_part_00
MPPSQISLLPPVLPLPAALLDSDCSTHAWRPHSLDDRTSDGWGAVGAFAGSRCGRAAAAAAAAVAQQALSQCAAPCLPELPQGVRVPAQHCAEAPRRVKAPGAAAGADQMSREQEQA